MIAEPLFTHIQIGELVTDQTVQRSLDMRRVNEIVRTFHVEAVGTWTISEREDGTKHTIDGQHRTAALKVKGYDDDYEVPALLYTGLSRADEARMFREHNNTKAI